MEVLTDKPFSASMKPLDKSPNTKNDLSLEPGLGCALPEIHESIELDTLGRIIAEVLIEKYDQAYSTKQKSGNLLPGVDQGAG
jgi:hypothetical protein